MTQPEALRLADALIHRHGAESFEGDAAAELRRQHEEITQLRHGAGVANRCIADIASQRDALLEALLKCSEQLTRLGYSANHADQAIAAIKQAEE